MHAIFVNDPACAVHHKVMYTAITDSTHISQDYFSGWHGSMYMIVPNAVLWLWGKWPKNGPKWPKIKSRASSISLATIEVTTERVCYLSFANVFAFNLNCITNISIRNNIDPLTTGYLDMDYQLHVEYVIFDDLALKIYFPHSSANEKWKQLWV